MPYQAQGYASAVSGPMAIRRPNFLDRGLYPEFCPAPYGACGTIYLLRPTLRSALRRGRAIRSASLALLQEGLALPRPLKDGRCALTAPFHPYPAPWPVSRSRELKLPFPT